MGIGVHDETPREIDEQTVEKWEATINGEMVTAASAPALLEMTGNEHVLMSTQVKCTFTGAASGQLVVLPPGQLGRPCK